MLTRNGYPITWMVDDVQGSTSVAGGRMPGATTIDQSGNAYTDYVHGDHLGSVDAITDDQGNVIQSMSFDAFGQRRDPANWDYDLSQNTISTLKDYTDRGYTDQEQLDNVALVDMNGRVYDPTSGRMISADPTLPDPMNSQGFNRYSYVDDNPPAYTDPSGYDPNWALVGAGAIDTGSGLLGIAASAGLLYLAGELGGNYYVGTSALLVGVAGAYQTGVGGLEIYQGLEGYSQPEIPNYMSTTATAAGLATDPGNTLGQDLIKKILLAKQDVINSGMDALIQKLKNLLISKPASSATQNSSGNGVPPGGNNQPQPGNGSNPLGNTPVTGDPGTPGPGDTTLCEMLGCNVTIGTPTSPPSNSCMKSKKGAKPSTCPT